MILQTLSPGDPRGIREFEEALDLAEQLEQDAAEVGGPVAARFRQEAESLRNSAKDAWDAAVLAAI